MHGFTNKPVQKSTIEDNKTKLSFSIIFLSQTKSNIYSYSGDACVIGKWEMEIVFIKTDKQSDLMLMLNKSVESDYEYNPSSNQYEIDISSLKDQNEGFTFPFTNNSLTALADAIYKELGLGWLPFPENVPEEAKDYIVYTVNIKKAGQVFYAQWSATKDAWLSPFGGPMEDEYCKVIAYMEIPTYQPEDSHDIV